MSMSPPSQEEMAGDFFDEISKPSTDNKPQQYQPKPPLQQQQQKQQQQQQQQQKQETTKTSNPESTDFEAHIPKINTVTLVGRIGQAPEPRYFDDGKVVLRLSLAVRRKYHPLERQVRNIKSGEEETDWFNLEMWGRDAEYAGKYVTKGARVGITGTLNIDSWVDRMSGDEKSSAKIIVKQFDILESRAEAEMRRGNSGAAASGGGCGGVDPIASVVKDGEDDMVEEEVDNAEGGYNSYYKDQQQQQRRQADDGEDYKGGGDGPGSAGSGDFF
eukprot:CAMPEP_0198276040 /NCGR_PEP_ID=MMETSP1447-20131203/65098_1 /TAXON_ID=420782 /ORGANISM="Chaetoceros dichaeta, Strain CCMP1751" /LENGTH=272 /DNA_ID=CAMNT_0043970957 /DNA_START=214 /DNA_END=1032 /DNA_ORIENTATION=+